MKRLVAVSIWLGCLGVLLSAATLLAQVPPEEQARRLLEDGRSARKAGKIKQALDSFGIIVTGFPNTSSVDDALLEIGRTHLESSGDYDKARQAFDQVATRFPQGDAAPGAYFYLGWITLSRATTSNELDDALAQFSRLQKVYAGSEWVPKALHASGLVNRRARRYQEAVDAQRRVFLEYPNDPVAPQAIFQCAHVLGLLGRHRDAMETFQFLRNRFPKHELAPRALDRLAALYRVFGGTRPMLALDPAFGLTAGQILKDVTGLFVTPDLTLWVAAPKANGAVPFEGTKMGPSINVTDPVGLMPLTDPSLGIGVVGKSGLQIGRRRDYRAYTVPSDKPGTVRPLEKIAAAVQIPSGGLLISDLKLEGIFRFDANGRYLGRFPDNTPREVSRLLRDCEGDLVYLNDQSNQIRTVDSTGRAIRSIGPKGDGYELRKPVDIAVDEALNVYVADKETGVYLLNAQGRLLLKIGDATLRRPTAVALAPDGVLYVYDEKLEKVVRFR